MSKHSEDAKHHRAEAFRSLSDALRFARNLDNVRAKYPECRDDMDVARRMTRTIVDTVEHLEAAAVANVMHLLRTRLDGMRVDGPARAALEQLLRDE